MSFNSSCAKVKDSRSRDSALATEAVTIESFGCWIIPAAPLVLLWTLAQPELRLLNSVQALLY